MHEQSRKLTILFTRITAAARIVRLVGVALIQNGLFVNNTVLRQEIFLPFTLFCKRAITTAISHNHAWSSTVAVEPADQVNNWPRLLL